MSIQSKIPNDIDIRDAFFDEIYSIASKNSNVMFLTADMGALSLDRFKKDLPKQYINVGIAEQNLVSIAAGLALAGKKVFAYTIASFMVQRCYEQVKIDLCVMRLPVTIIGSGPGITYSSEGPTHHTIGDIAIMRVLPGMTILNPSDSLTAAAVAQLSYKSDGPVYVRIDKGKLPVIHDKKEDFSDGLTVLKEGRDIMIIATGIMVHHAFRVAEKLAKHSVDAGIIDLYRLKPINEDLLLSFIEKSKGIVTLEEHSVIGGVGSAVSEILVDKGKSLPVKRIGIPDKYCLEYGSRDWMYSFYGLDVADITDTILKWQPKDSYSSRKKFNQGAEGLPEDSTYSELTLEDFAHLLGTTVEDISRECRELIDKTDFRYRILLGDERNKVLLDVLKKIDSGTLGIAGLQKKTVWEKGWAENLNNFLEKGYDLEQLTPKYYRPGQSIRVNRKYAKGYDPNFEYNFFKVLRLWLYKKYLKDAGSVYEFGCGPGHNLIALAKLYPEKEIYGLDWANSSMTLVNKIAEVYKLKIKGYLFDMLNPDESLQFDRDSAVITMGALEQLGSDYLAFLQFVLRNAPIVCVNVEPFCELYDENNLLDYVAISHHKKRNLLGDYLASLRELESEGKIAIEKIQRVFMGGVLEDGWSYVVWRPVGLSR